MNGKLTMIPVAEIFPTPHNPRHIRQDDPAITDLANSIKAVGLLHPVICRKAKGIEGIGKYELLAGRRRFEAHLTLGLDAIMAIVAPLDDAAALEVTVTENMQREDLTPLEESRGVAALLNSGREVSDVAAKLGKSEAWVRRRARLATLSQAWLDAIEGPISIVDDVKAKAVANLREHISAAVLEIAAHLPEKTQDAILKKLLSDSWRTEPMRSATGFRSLVSDFCRTLGDAPWPKNQTFTDGRGNNLMACVDCSARSDREPDLFLGLGRFGTVETDGDGNPINVPHCLDATCYKAKYMAFMEDIRHQAERKAGGTVLTLSTCHGVHTPKTDVTSWQMRPAKKGDKDAVPAVAVDGKNAGKLVYIKLDKHPASAGEAPEAAPSIREQRLAHMIQAFNDWLQGIKGCLPDLRDPMTMLVAIAHYGNAIDLHDVATPAAFDAAKEGTAELWDALWASLQECMPINHFRHDDNGLDAEERQLDLALHVCGLDKQDFIDNAESAFPDADSKPAAKAAKVYSKKSGGKDKVKGRK